MIADLNEIKGILYELITVINAANRYLKVKDYVSAFKYAHDLEEYAWEFYTLMEYYRD